MSRSCGLYGWQYAQQTNYLYFITFFGAMSLMQWSGKWLGSKKSKTVQTLQKVAISKIRVQWPGLSLKTKNPQN